MTLSQQIITILAVVLATICTRFLPFWLFPANKPTPKAITYLANLLPSAVFGLLIVYCLKDVALFSYPNGIAQCISIFFIIVIHLLKRNMLLSIASGTIVYIVLINFIFI